MANEPNTQADQPTAEPKPAPEKKSLMMKILMIGVPLFLLQIVVIYFLMAKLIYPSSVNHQQESAPAGETVKAEGEGETEPEVEEAQIFVVKDLIVNPAGTNGTRFLLTTVGYEVGTAQVKTELEKKEVLIRDMLNTVLGSRGLEQLGDLKQKELLRAEIAEKTNALLKEGKLKNVYFSKFIIQ